MLEDLLNRLCCFGEPMMRKMKEGWHCKLDVFVAGAGVKLEICSEHNHKTPTDAAALCMGRLEHALAEMSKTSGQLQTLGGKK